MDDPKTHSSWQLYLNKDRKKSAEILRKVERLGFKAIMLTVDAPVLGKRERDIKNRPPSEVCPSVSGVNWM
jgi:isopentenyl diphosphate isomerase/L-lactate dehydrogenase-like FMN-dependent dehydrogenase